MDSAGAAPLRVNVEIETVGGEEGAMLQAAQARIVRELLLWASDQHTKPSADTSGPTP